MKLIRYIVLICAAILSTATGMAQVAGKPMQAELLRSTSGRGLDSSGFANTSVPLQKGAIYDVLKQGNGNVLLSVEGKQVMLPMAAVSITEKPLALEPTADGFVPGKIVLVSAKYTLTGNQPQNVKNHLQKLIPQTIITAPVVITVTDGLSTGAQDEGQSQTTVVVTNTGVGVSSRTVAKNVLTVQYIFNGKKFTKQVPEGGQLILP